MSKLIGVKTINTANGLQRGTLHATRNAARRIMAVELEIDTVGVVSFSHIRIGSGNAAERLEALRASACPMSAVRVRRYERDAARGISDEFIGVPHLDAV